MDEQLRKDAPAAMREVSSMIKAAAAGLEAHDDRAAHDAIEAGKRVLLRYRDLKPPVAEMTALAQELGVYERRLSAIVNAKSAMSEGETRLHEAQMDLKEEDYVAADKIYNDLLKKLDVPEGSARYVDMKAVKKLRTTVDAKRRAIAAKVKKQEAAIATRKRASPSR
jgi:hypothetical protein